MENSRNPDDLFLRLQWFILPLPSLTVRPQGFSLFWSSGPVPSGKVSHRLVCATEGHNSSLWLSLIPNAVMLPARCSAIGWLVGVATHEVLSNWLAGGGRQGSPADFLVSELGGRVT